MASGSFKTGWGSYSKDYELIVDWSSTSNIAANTSTVTVVIKFYCPYSCDISKRYSNKVNINGVVYEYDSPAINTRGEETFTLATITSGAIAHNADGTKSIAISVDYRFKAGLSGIYYDTQTASKTVALDNIPRAATIVSAQNFNDEENPTITYSNSAGNAVTSLKACISLDGSKDDIAYRDISKTGSSYTFNLTTAERNVLRNATKTANSRTVRFYIQTVIGGETYLKSISKTLTIVNAKPTINPTIKDVGSASILLTGDANNKLIKGYNNMSITIGAAALKGATIVSQKVECGGKTIIGASGNLRNVESKDFVFTVTDSRGNTTKKTVSKTLINYIKLTCDLKASMPTTDGIMSYEVSGKYFNGSFGTVSNTLTLQYRHKIADAEFGDWEDLAFDITSNTYKTTGMIGGFDYRDTVTIQARAIDKIYNDSTEEAVESVIKTVKTLPVFDWGENDFNFNVPVTLPNGTPLQGKSTEGDNINIAYINAGNTLTIGGGAYAPANITMGTKSNSGTVMINGKKFASNNVLWTGSYYMTEGQTANLNYAISTQVSGIVLVFSRYDISNSEPLNEHFSCHFVPKIMVELQGGKGFVFNMNTATYSYAASKYLYISDTEIKGNAANDTVGTGDNGITHNNNRFVLRYVIGV